ncbi:hypothetical protein MTO96_032656 [Rhipicephalus appendiculatus]
MHRPFLYLYGPLGLNYGGLGMIIGHELMHALDVRHAKLHKWWHEIEKGYTDRALCLRRSHRSVLSRSVLQALNDTVDSENLADLVGTMIAYAAFSSLPEKYKSVKLVNFNMTSEQLFFVNHCAKWCAHLTKINRTLRAISLTLHSSPDEHARVLEGIRLWGRNTHESA